MATFAGVVPVHTVWGAVYCRKLYSAMGFPSFATDGLSMAQRGYAAEPSAEDGGRGDVNSDDTNVAGARAGAGMRGGAPSDHNPVDADGGGLDDHTIGGSKPAGGRARCYSKRMMHPRDKKRDA